MLYKWIKNVIDYTHLMYDIEQRLEKKLNDVNSSNNHINNVKEMVTNFKDKNNKSKRNMKNINF